jgi:hypothetical protein
LQLHLLILEGLILTFRILLCDLSLDILLVQNLLLTDLVFDLLLLLSESLSLGLGEVLLVL